MTPEPLDPRHPPLEASDPATWLATHLAARYDDDHGGDVSPTDPARKDVGVGDLLADDAAVLRRIHRRLTADGTPGPAAATYLADWFGGSVAGAVGYGLATAVAGFLADARGLRWVLHPDGWPERVGLGPVTTVVEGSHPWAGRPGVEVADSPSEVLDRAVAALVVTVTPVIDAVHGLARVGRAGLWNEVGDGLGMALAHQLAVPVTQAMTGVLEAAVSRPGGPWRASPSLRFAEASWGRIHVAQKGGCCLAYTGPEVPAEPEGEPTAEDLAYESRFPTGAGEPSYCSTCSFRDPADCDARQVFWLELERARRAATH